MRRHWVKIEDTLRKLAAHIIERLGEEGIGVAEGGLQQRRVEGGDEPGIATGESRGSEGSKDEMSLTSRIVGEGSEREERQRRKKRRE